ncbi:Ldh family oxidoreductase, partial [uncultured Sutterella sp.]|uniref:Ldh family oxidoreductase n=1 Tax=uncultured Sutterella sp. TaxID=286133 RepID=UPI0025D05245
MRHSEHELRNAAEKWLSATGSNAYEAKVVADHLVNANLRGHDSHGVGMIAIYRDFIQDGRLKPNTAPRLLNDRGSILQFAGDRGYGQRIGHDATEQAIARAKETGLCLYTIANTCHLGRIGTYGEQCADAGMVSLHFVNVQHFQPLVAPWGGSDARFGTNPFCCAIPATEKNGRFILD